MKYVTAVGLFCGCLSLVLGDTPYDKWSDSPQAHCLQESVGAALEETWYAGFTASQSCELLPWVECNVPLAKAYRAYSWWPEDGDKEMTVLSHIQQGVKEWSYVSPRIMVTTRIGQLDNVYPSLVRASSGVTIIGGFKTSDVLLGVGFDSVAGWLQIRDGILRVVELTGVNICVLENEGALQPYHEGKVDIRLPQMAAALWPIKECGVHVWWNLPTVLGPSSSFPTRTAATAKLVTVFAKVVPDSTFFVGYHRYWRHKFNDPETELLYNQMCGLVGVDRLQQRTLLTDGRDPRRFTPSQALMQVIYPTNIDGSRGERQWGDIVNLYPGAECWVETGRMMRQLQWSK